MNVTVPAATAVGVGVIAIAVLVGGCKQSPVAGGNSKGGGATEQTGQVQSVKMIAVETREVERTIEVTGTLFGEEEVSLAAEAPGRIVSVDVDLGDMVEAGAKLAQIDTKDYQLAVDEARAGLAAALAKVGLQATPSGEVDLSTLPLVARAIAQENNARAKLERARKLFERTPPLLSEQDYADIQTQHEVAVTTVGVERLNAQSLVADALVKASALRVAEERLANTRVSAPKEKNLSYRVATRRVSAGEVVAQGQALFRLVASDRVKFRGMVPERFAQQVVKGARAQLVLDSIADPAEATVSRVAPAVDAATRSFEVEVEADNANGALKPGSFARSRIFSSKQAGVRFVPATAVMQFAGVSRVYSVKNGKTVEHRVELGEAHEGWLEVLSGLDGVEQVIDSPRGLRSGTPVNAR